MSFIRDPKRFDLEKSTNSLITKDEIDHHLSLLDDILSSHRYFNREAKNSLESKVETIAYLLDHPKLSNKVNKLKKLDETYQKVKNIKGVNTDCLKDLVPDYILAK